MKMLSEIWSLFTVLVISGMDTRIAATTNVSDLTNHPAWKILNSYECGESSADRIIGGTNTALGQFPWIVRLGYLFPDDPKTDWMCGGALITDRAVLTAAHCIPTGIESYSLHYIRVGEHNIHTDPDCEMSVCAPPVQDRAIKKIVKHPSFNNPAFHNDIAFIELGSPVTINDYVTPVCLPQNAEQRAYLKIGDTVQVAGWGKMNMTTEERASILQVLSLPVVKPELCDTLGEDFKLDESEICAGAKINKDACVGDSGGPLMKVYDTDDGPKTYLKGVVSFGPDICGINKPGVYTSVSYFLKWILDQIA